MIITKIFNVESAHIVRNCTSERCSHSIHGHSAKIEVSFKCNNLDNAQMVMDFGLMKDHIKKFVDSMDHAYLLCSADKESFKTFIHSYCDRYITLPFNPSAEMLSMFVFWGIEKLLKHTEFSNGEGNVEVYSVKYHETATGSATCFREDMENIWKKEYEDVRFSQQIQKEWDSLDMSNLFNSKGEEAYFICPEIEQQIELK